MKQIHLGVGNNNNYLFCFLLIFVSGCGGGGGNFTTTSNAATVDPASGETEVERDVVITATFKEDMLASTIDNTSFTLSDGSNISGTVAYSELTRVATFTPSADLILLRNYTATLSADITNLSSTPITALSWSFTVRDGTWSMPAKIETDDINDASYPQIAFDSDGNAIAIWINGTDVYANYYTASTGLWGTAQAIENTDAGVADVQIAMDNNGNGIAVWSHYIAGKQTIYTNRYTVNMGWGTEAPLENNTGNARYPQIAIDGTGNAIVVWLQPSNAAESIWVSHYAVSGGTWSTAALLESDDGEAFAPQIAIDDGGDTIVVWAQNNNIYDAVYAAYYTANVSWSTPVQLEVDAIDSSTPDIALDGSGNAIAVWQQQSGGINSIWANRYSGGAWGTAAVIESQGLAASDPLVGFDGNGNAMAVWRHNARVRYNTYTSGVGWGSDAAAETGTDSAAFIRFAIDSGGNAIAVWRQVSNAVESTWYNRYQASAGWGTAALIESNDTQSTSSAEVSIDRNGNAFVVWTQSDGTKDSIWASRFD